MKEVTLYERTRKNELDIVKNDVESSISFTENLINKLELNPTVIDYLEKLKLWKKD